MKCYKIVISYQVLIREIDSWFIMDSTETASTFFVLCLLAAGVIFTLSATFDHFLHVFLTLLGLLNLKEWAEDYS